LGNSTQINNIKSIRLLKATIPNTIYNIRAGVNNVVRWFEGSNKSVTIPAGVYNINQLCNTLTTLMTGFTITYNSTTLKTRFTNASFFNLDMSGSDTPFRELGFDQINYPGTDDLSSPNTVSLASPYDLFIKIEELGFRTRTTSARDMPTFIVPVNGAPTQVIEYREKTEFDQSIHFETAININTWTVTLSFATGELCNLNGSEWNIILELL
jgi:hypothetical protein